MFVCSSRVSQFRILCVAALWLSSALTPALALSPVEQPMNAIDALAELGPEDLAWASPRMRDYMRQWFDVAELDESPCAPADVKLAPITSVCEYKPANQSGYTGPPQLLLGIVGQDKNSARVGSVVSQRALSYPWSCRPSQLGTFVCLSVGADSNENEQVFARWDKWLPRNETELLAWYAADPEMRYIQSVLASGKAMPADVPGLLAWKQWQGMAMNMVRMERLVLIGQICRVLNPDDAQTILRNASAELAQHRFQLTDQYRSRAKDWLKALRIGATQSARVSDVTDEASCQRFAEPYGTLSKLLTWTDKPQESAPGVRASPWTLP